MTVKGAAPELRLWEAPLCVIGDRGALSRIFANLLQNTFKHGGGDVRIESGEEDGMAATAFTNRAEGLRDADAERLFQRFFTADRVRSQESAGLGLAICKEFAEQMGGTVSAGLEGTLLTIRVCFPLAERSDKKTAA